MPTRRLLADSLVAIALATCLGVVGWLVAMPLLARICAYAGIERLVVMGPAEFLHHQTAIAAAFAVPPVVAWVAALLERAIAGSVPRLARLVLYFALPSVAAACGLARTGLFARMATTEARGDVGLHDALITVESLGLGPTALRWEIGCAILLCAAVAISAVRQARRAQS